MAERAKILFITSFYSALRSSIESGVWQPTGMPAMVRLFEGLKKNFSFDVVLIDKLGIHKKHQSEVTFEEFAATFYVFSALKYLSGLAKKPGLNKIIQCINGLFYLYYIILIIKKSNSNIIYTDRENVAIAALLTLLFNKRVILRIHGVGVLYDRFSNFFLRVRYLIRYFSFKVPFKYILCSEDGTPVNEFLARFTSLKAPKSILLNGVDNPHEVSINIKKKHRVPDKLPIILFVARLEKDKGADVFVQCLRKLNEINPNFYALIVGSGRYFDELRTQVKNFHNIIFTGAVNHSDIYSYYKNADIYVSLNSMGNLCNTVLEALKAGNCVVTYKKDRVSLRDKSTESYLKNVAVFIDRYNVLTELPQKLNELLLSPEKLHRRKIEARNRADQLLKTWQERIDQEIGLIGEAFN